MSLRTKKFLSMSRSRRARHLVPISQWVQIPFDGSTVMDFIKEVNFYHLV